MKIADKTKEAASWVSDKAKEAGTWIDDKVKSAWDNIFQSNNNDKFKGKPGEIKRNGKQETKGRMVELSRNGMILIMEILSFILILMIMILHGMKRVILFIVIQLIILMMRLHLNRC